MSPTRSQRLLLDQATAIALYEPELTFMPSVMTQVSLPRSRFDGEKFTRRNGDAWISITAGDLDQGHGPVAQPLPYGPMPRLIMSYLTSYSKKYQTPEIFIGTSASAFLDQLGMAGDGRRHRTLHQQMNSLAACRLQMGYRGRTYNGSPIKQFDEWFNDPEIGRFSIWPGTLTLSDDYYQVIEETAVPLDLRAMMALRGSALALDIYFWLAHRLHRINGSSVLLHWKSLQEQFSPGYSIKNFKKKFLPALERVLLVYPQAQVSQVKGGLLLRASPPPVKYKE